MGVVECVGGIIMDKNREKLLGIMPKHGNIHIIPGGKVNPGENPEHALVREIEREKIKGIKIVEYHPFMSYYNLGKAYYDDGELKMDTFLVKIEGTPGPSSEIKDMRWISEDDISNNVIKVADLYRLLFKDLKETGIMGPRRF